MVYCIVALVALAALAGWLIWRCLSLRKELDKSKARARELMKDRAIRQNLQHVLRRRESDIRNLKEKVADYESRFEEMENQTHDLNMSLFQESGLRILAQKGEGANRMKLDQLEKQVEALQARLRQKDVELEQTEQRLQAAVAERDKEIERLQAVNARRLARRARIDSGGLDQVTLDDVLGTEK